MTYPLIAFVGGGNMAQAILGGLRRQGHPADRLLVVEPFEATRDVLLERLQVRACASVQELPWSTVHTVVWAIKPQGFKDIATPLQTLTQHALHLSVAAGVRSDSIAQWLGTQRIVRAMPNTPALIGQGVTGLFARSSVSTQDRHDIEQIVRHTGEMLWLAQESDLDAVTALSGSGPAYVFYFIEAMIQAGCNMGLAPEQAKHLALSTLRGATELARQSEHSPSTLRQQVTSKGGTTDAALRWLDQHQVQAHFIEAMEQARQRAVTLGDEFGKV